MSFPFPWPEYLPTLGNLRFWKGVSTLDTEVRRMVTDRRASGEVKPDLLSMLLDSVDEETGQAMNDEQLRDELITMLIAGHETTANAMAWTLYLLAEHPDVQAALHAELDRVLGDRDPTVADMDALRPDRAGARRGHAAVPTRLGTRPQCGPRRPGR